MKKLSLFAALFALAFAFVAVPVIAQDEPVEEEASPAEVLDTMLAAWQKGDIDTVIACMDTGDSDPEAAESIKTYIGLMIKSIIIEKYEIGETTINEDDEGSAEVACKLAGTTDVEAYKAGYWAMMGMSREEYCKMLMSYGMSEEEANKQCDEIDSGAEESLTGMTGDMFDEEGTTAWLTLTEDGWKVVEIGGGGGEVEEEDGSDGMDD